MHFVAPYWLLLFGFFQGARFCQPNDAVLIISRCASQRLTLPVPPPVRRLSSFTLASCMGSSVSSSRGRETRTVVGNVSSSRASPSDHDAMALSPNIQVPSFESGKPRVSIKTSPAIRKALTVFPVVSPFFLPSSALVTPLKTLYLICTDSRLPAMLLVCRVFPGMIAHDVFTFFTFGILLLSYMNMVIYGCAVLSTAAGGHSRYIFIVPITLFDVCRPANHCVELQFANRLIVCMSYRN